MECNYDSLEQFSDDIDLLVNNCSTYWSQASKQTTAVALGAGAVPEGVLYIQNAMKLQDAVQKSLSASRALVGPKVDSTSGGTASAAAPSKGKGKSAGGGGGGVSAAASALAYMPRVPFSVGKPANGTSSSSGDGDVGSAVVSGKVSSSTAGSSVSVAAVVGTTTKTAALSAAPATSSQPLSAAATTALLDKINKFLRAAFKLSIDGVKAHYIVVPATGVHVPTADPFLKAVDPFKIPDYAEIIADPIDIGKIEKKLNNGKYNCTCLASADVKDGANVSGADLAVSAILSDMTLLRDNVHQYNSDPLQGADIRFMADCVLNYFKYNLRECLKYLQQQQQTQTQKGKVCVMATNHGIKDVQFLQFLTLYAFPRTTSYVFSYLYD